MVAPIILAGRPDGANHLGADKNRLGGWPLGRPRKTLLTAEIQKGGLKRKYQPGFSFLSAKIIPESYFLLEIPPKLRHSILNP